MTQMDTLHPRIPLTTVIVRDARCLMYLHVSQVTQALCCGAIEEM